MGINSLRPTVRLDGGELHALIREELSITLSAYSTVMDKIFTVIVANNEPKSPHIAEPLYGAQNASICGRWLFSSLGGSLY